MDEVVHAVVLAVDQQPGEDLVRVGARGRARVGARVKGEW